MRIVHLLWGFSYGGIETMVINIANEQSRRGHSVSLVVIDSRIDESLAANLDKSVKLYCIGRPQGSHNPWYVLKLNNTIRRIKADFIHFHGVNIPQLICKRYVKRWCTTHHTTWIKNLAKYFSDDLHIFAISNKAAEDLAKNANIHPKVVVNGIPTSDYQRRDATAPGKCLQIVQIGRLNPPIKGQDLTIAATKILKDKGLSVHVDFIGDGEAAATLKQMIKDFGLQNEISLTGPMPQEYLKAHLKDYDLLVQPSRIEGFGLTVAEAMAACVPVVVSDLPPLLEVINNGECGLSFKADDATDLARAIENTISNYDLDRIALAADRAKRLYDVSTTAVNYLKEYENF